MSGELDVSPAHIRAAASGIRSSAEEFSGQVKEFQGQVHGLTEPAGQDPISPLIWAAHDAVFNAALRCFASNTRAMHSHAGRLALAATGYEAAETANTAEVNRVREILG